MTTSVDLSIVTITWNNLLGLRSTLESIRTQSGQASIEIIIVDNLSDDGSTEYVNQLSDPRIVHIREQDAGIYDALNKGTTRSKSSHVLYLNAGDYLRDEHALSRMLALVRANADAPMVACGAMQIEGDGSEKRLRNVPHHWFLHAFGMRSACHAAIVFRTAAVRAAGGYSTTADFAGDFDLILRLGLLGAVPSDRSVCVNYDGSGLSAVRKREIPLLLHRIRTSRFQYPSWMRLLDRFFVAVLEGYRVLRRVLHRR